jgi:hypothetical protein
MLSLPDMRAFPVAVAVASAAAVAVLLLGCHRKEVRPPPVGLTVARPSTEAECRACNGEWGVHGLMEVQSCRCHTRDAGKRCKDGLECEGECVLQSGATEVVEPGPPRRGYFVGRCSEFDVLFGCYPLLTDGTVAHGPTSLEEPPADVCID